MSNSYYNLPTKKARLELLKSKLGLDKQWALRGLLKIADNQTQDELRSERTVEHNGVGFTAFDAEILTSLASQYRTRNSLSPKQMRIVFKRMPKYAGQLDKIAQERISKEGNVTSIASRSAQKASAPKKIEQISQSLGMASSDW